MKNKILYTLLICLFCLNGFMAFGATYTFTNAGGDNLWTTGANWTNGLPPQTLPISDAIVIVANCTVANYSIINNGTITINAARTLTVSGSIEATYSLTNNGTFNNSGTLSLVSYMTFANNALSTFTNNSGASVTTSVLSALNNRGTFTNLSGGSLTVGTATPAPFVNLDNQIGGVLNNYGNIINNARFSNSEGSIFNNYGSISSPYHAGAIANSGTINLSGVNSIFDYYCSFVNLGSFIITSGSNLVVNNFGFVQYLNSITWQSGGTITYNVPLSIANTLTVDAGRIFVINSNVTISNGGSLVNNGTLKLQGSAGTISIGGSLTNSGTMQILNPGALVTNYGTFTNTATLSNQWGIYNHATFNNTGTLSGGTFDNKVGATFTNSGTYSGVYTTNSGTFTNSGIYNLNNTNNTLTLNTNPATLPSGTFNWTAGRVEIGTNGVFQLSTNLTTTGNQSLLVNGSMTITNAATLTSGGSMTINGTIHNNGIIESSSAFFLNSIGIVNNAGTINNGYFIHRYNGRVNNTGTIRNSSTLSIDATGILNNNTNGTVINNGTLTNDGAFNNNALLKGDNGLTGSFSGSNPVVFGANATLEPATYPGRFGFSGTTNLATTLLNCTLTSIDGSSALSRIAFGGVNLTNANLQIDWGSYVPNPGFSFKILSFTSRTGQLASVYIPPIAGIGFTTTYNANDLTITTFDNTVTIQSANNGAWNTPATWAGGVVPTLDNPVVINAGHDVVLSSTQQCRSLNIVGQLTVQLNNTLSVGSADITILGNNKDLLVGGTLNVGGTVNVGGRVIVSGTLGMFGGTLAINGKNTNSGNSIAAHLFKINGGSTFTALAGTIVLYPHLTAAQNIIEVPFKFYDLTHVQVNGFCAGVTLKLFSRDRAVFTINANPNMVLFNLELDHQTNQATYHLSSVNVVNNFTAPIVTGPSTSRIVNTTGFGDCSFASIDLKSVDQINGSVFMKKRLTSCGGTTFIKAGSISLSSLSIVNETTPTEVLIDNYNQNVTLEQLNLVGGKIKFGTTAGLPDVRLGTILNGDATHYIKKGTSKLIVDIANPIVVPLVYEDNTGAENFAPIHLAYSSPFPVQGSADVAVATTSVTDIPVNKAAIKHAWTVERMGFFSPTTMILSWKVDAETNPAFATGRANCQIFQKSGTTWTAITTVAGPTSFVNGVYHKQVALSELAGNTPIVFTIMTEAIQPATTITSRKDGAWDDPTAWSSFFVPRAIDDVIVATTIANTTFGGQATCKNLTINLNSTLNQNGRLIIGGNLTINGTFDHNQLSNLGNFSTEIGAQAGAIGALSTSPAGNRLVTVNGTLSLGGSTDEPGFCLAGRMVFTGASSTFRMKLNSNLTLTGWSDPNSATPQYLMDIDNLTTLDLQAGNEVTTIKVTHSNGTHPIISGSRGFIESCKLNNYGARFNLMNNNTYYFGNGTTNQFIQPIAANDAILYLNRVTLRKFSTRRGNVYSNKSEFSDMSVEFQSTLNGSYTLIDNCTLNGNTIAPNFRTESNVFFHNDMSFRVNVTDTATLEIPTGSIYRLGNIFQILNGRVVVKGGTLDLRSSTVTGLSNTRYFETKVGTGDYATLGAVLLPAASATPITFNLGITIPNGSNPPISVYAPVGIVSNNGSNNVAVSLEPSTVPSGYVAPSIRWNITPTTTPASLTITFTWPASVESTQFGNNRRLARVYHINSAGVPNALTPVYPDPVNRPNDPITTNADGSFSITVANITEFSPFEVRVPTAVLKAELITFSAKDNNNKAELNWQTASELNVKNFDIEKSLNGKTFEKIAEIKANNTPSVYSAFDDQFFTSSYYRLKINDLNGEFNYSKTLYLEKNSDKTLKITQDREGSVLIETTDKIELITVTNSIGQLIKSTKEKRFLISELNSGIYIISVKTDKGFLSKKIFKN